jgi:ATP-dependent Clp protease ATP-binding subunit ClpA
VTVRVSYGDRVFDNYSVGARGVVSLATAEAHQLDHARIGTEHLLLGLLADEDGEPAALLRAAGARLAAARHKVSELGGAGPESPGSDQMPFTARAQRALERAGRFSRQARATQVSAGHVLLGVLDVEGLACQVLRGLGVDLVQLNLAVVACDAISEAQPAVVEVAPAIDAVRPTCPRCRADLDDTLAEVVMDARRRDLSAINVSVIYCAACGTTLGVVPLTSS